MGSASVHCGAGGGVGLGLDGGGGAALLPPGQRRAQAQARGARVLQGVSQGGGAQASGALK